MTLLERVREAIGLREGVTERRMFGSLVFMLNGNMACGVRDDLLVRLDRAEAAEVVALDGVSAMEMAGRKAKGFVRVDSTVLEDDAELARWVDAGFNYAASLPPKA